MSVADRVRGLLFKAVSAGMQSTTGVSLTDLRLGLFLAGGPAYSGKAVTVDSAMQLDAVWACVKLVSDTISTLPLQLYDGADPDAAQIARDHPLYPILHDQPNADMTASEFWRAMVGSMMLWGNAFAQIVRRGDGAVIALNPLLPSRMTVRRDPVLGTPIYRYSYQGQVLTIAEADIFHLKGFSLDGLLGMSPVSTGKNSLGSATAAEETAGKTFANGLLTQNYLSSPDWLRDDQVDRAKDVLEGYAGAINAGKTPLLEGNWQVKSIGANPEAMQLLQTRSFSIETICRWFGNVPPPMIGHTDKATTWGTGLEQMNLRFVQYTLQPILVDIEGAIRKALLRPAERARYYAKFKLEGLMRGDSAARSAFYGAMVDKGIMTRNEIRALEDLPPLTGGDVLTVQAQMIPIDDVGKVAKVPTVETLPPGDAQQPNNPEGQGNA